MRTIAAIPLIATDKSFSFNWEMRDQYRQCNKMCEHSWPENLPCVQREWIYLPVPLMPLYPVDHWFCCSLIFNWEMTNQYWQCDRGCENFRPSNLPSIWVCCCEASGDAFMLLLLNGCRHPLGSFLSVLFGRFLHLTSTYPLSYSFWWSWDSPETNQACIVNRTLFSHLVLSISMMWGWAAS